MPRKPKDQIKVDRSLLQAIDQLLMTIDPLTLSIEDQVRLEDAQQELNRIFGDHSECRRLSSPSS